MYQFSERQANVIGAPVGADMFGEIDQVYSRDNASTKAHYGTSTVDAISYEAANRQFVNDSMALGVDCAQLNVAAGRPNLGNVTSGGSACYQPSISQQAGSKAMDASYNSYGPSAEQIVLAQGDVLRAPSRFADLQSYAGPSLSDDSFQPRLMGTRDEVASGCSTSVIDQTVGNTTVCALADDPLPYPNNTDPRVGYGVDSPHSAYWSPIDQVGSRAMAGCQVSMGDDSAFSMCDTQSVNNALPARQPRQYVPVPQSAPSRAQGGARMNRGKPVRAGNGRGSRISPAVRVRTVPKRRQ
jgi:hypothetical protein